MSQNKHKVFHNIVLYLVFGIYVFILLFLLFFRSRSMRSVNLIPFHSIMNYLGGSVLARSFSFMNVVGNIVLFIPFGVYLLLFHKNKKILVNTGLVFLFSVGVEIIQYIFKLGVTDIDDVILNVLGGFIGIIICKVILHFWKEQTRYVIELLAPIGGVIGFIVMTWM